MNHKGTEALLILRMFLNMKPTVSYSKTSLYEAMLV